MKIAHILALFEKNQSLIARSTPFQSWGIYNFRTEKVTNLDLPLNFMLQNINNGVIREVIKIEQSVY